MLKAYKYRLYPNKEQEELIEKTFGCCRFVYNKTLSYRKDKYKNNKESMNKTSCNNYVNQILKKQYKWLKEVDKFALTNSVYNMDNSYKKFFKEHTGYPKFKSKKDNHKSYTTNFTNKNIEVSFNNNKIKLPKLKWIKAKIHHDFIGNIKNATLSKTPSGKYFVSILVDCKSKLYPKSNNKIGIDMGIKNLLITSNGEVFDNKRFTNKYSNKLTKEQRKLAHKIKGSNNWNKQRIKVAKIHEKIANQRKDYLNKISKQIINENQVIICEDLHIKDMSKNKRLSKAILDCAWGELTRQLKYKSEWYGRIYHEINRYFPSSQLCNKCGYQNRDVKNLGIRFWECPKCGKLHDRDNNASINILNKGLQDLGLL